MFSARSGQPASTVTVPAATSTVLIDVIRSGRSSTPSVTTAGVNECPVPVIRTVSPSAAALLISAAISSAEPGEEDRLGRAVTFPAQLCHAPTVRSALLRIDPLCRSRNTETANLTSHTRLARVSRRPADPDRSRISQSAPDCRLLADRSPAGLYGG